MQNILRTPCNQIFKIYEKRTATFFNCFNVFSQMPTKNFCITTVSMICQSKDLRMAEGARMRQVEVDDYLGIPNIFEIYDIHGIPDIFSIPDILGIHYFLGIPDFLLVGDHPWVYG